jgi:hypothetical protein
MLNKQPLGIQMTMRRHPDDSEFAKQSRQRDTREITIRQKRMEKALS